MKQHLVKILWTALAALMMACQNDTDTLYIPQATVTWMVAPNGLGDNGYNDAAIKGAMAFSERTRMQLHLLQPRDVEEATTLCRRWLNENCRRDSALLIVGSTVYEQMMHDIASTEQEQLTALQEQGGRVLLMESNEEIAGITTLMLNRYGASYLAGAMTGNFDALILAATPHYPTLEEAIRGFQDGHKAHSAAYYGDSCRTSLRYLADGEEGFAMPDSAYAVASRLLQDAAWNHFIFPLLGGSNVGVVRSFNDLPLTAALLVGMDVNQAGQSARIPFSLVVNIGDVVQHYLADWHMGKAWPQTRRWGLGDGATEIVINRNFAAEIDLWDDRYADDDVFQKRYDQYKDEAIRMEEAYEK